MAIRDEWYNKTFILFELAKACYKRELCFLPNKTVKGTGLPAIRCCKAFSISFLKTNFEKFRFYERNFDAFTSISTFKDFPMFSFNPVERKAQMENFFNLGGFDNTWENIDFIIDIDNKDVNDSYNDTKRLKVILDEFNVPYSLRYSGNRGFHFVVEGEKFFPQDMPLPQRVKCSRIIAQNLNEIENIPSIDTGIYDRERVLKLPYSLVNENVCLPLTDKNFDEWKVDDMHYSKVLQKFVLKNRGLLARDKIINFKGLNSIYGGILNE
jgi:hypothetical protein